LFNHLVPQIANSFQEKRTFFEKNGPIAFFASYDMPKTLINTGVEIIGTKVAIIKELRK